MTTIQKGDTVLVTGATGYIGGHVVEELIAAGYKVRGTSRNHTKAQFLVDYIEKKFGGGKLELVDVPEMAAENAYDEAVQGVSGIVHLASAVTLSPIPEEVITPAVKGALSILSAATKEPKVKSLVLTSSSVAALTPIPDQKIIVTKDTWNDAAIEEARTAPHPFNVYSASKTEAERALWKAVKETNPPFQVSTVLPNANFGTRFKETGNTTADWLLWAYNGTDKMLYSLPPQHYINTSDDAKLHVVALTDPACNGERIFAFAAPYNMDSLLAIFRKLEPSKDFGPDVGDGKDLSEVPNQEAEELLKKHYGHGFTGLEETIKQNIAPIA
ncbi:hypothetical protein Q7P37_004775 [Cladosporium fusiforme]